MGSTGAHKTLTSSHVAGLISKRITGHLPKQLGTDLQAAADHIHNEYPEVREISTIIPASLGRGVVASMNGLGMLEIDHKYATDYTNGVATNDRLIKTGWLAGETGSMQSVLSHELYHNVDMSFSSFLMGRAPDGGLDTQARTVNAATKAALEKATGKTLKIGDKVYAPKIDKNGTLFKLDGKTYSYQDFLKSTKKGHLSEFVVPLAMKNLKANYQAVGFSQRPTSSQLTNQVSGYAANSWHTRVNSMEEVFAECMNQYKSKGANSSALAQEVKRLTNSIYKQVSKRPVNKMTKFYDDLFSTVTKNSK